MSVVKFVIDILSVILVAFIAVTILALYLEAPLVDKIYCDLATDNIVENALCRTTK